MKRGAGAKFAVNSISSTLDTIYLTDVQGATFKAGQPIIHYGVNNDIRQTASGAATVDNTDSEVLGDLYTGNVIEIIQPNHAHHAPNNLVRIDNIKPDSIATQITSDLAVSGTTVSVASTSPFVNFAGVVLIAEKH